LLLLFRNLHVKSIVLSLSSWLGTKGRTKSPVRWQFMFLITMNSFFISASSIQIVEGRQGGQREILDDDSSSEHLRVLLLCSWPEWGQKVFVFVISFPENAHQPWLRTNNDEIGEKNETLNNMNRRMGWKWSLKITENYRQATVAIMPKFPNFSGKYHWKYVIFCSSAGTENSYYTPRNYFLSLPRLLILQVQNDSMLGLMTKNNNNNSSNAHCSGSMGNKGSGHVMFPR